MEAPKVGVSIEILHAVESLLEPDFDEVFFFLLKKIHWYDELALMDVRRYYREEPMAVIRGIHRALMQGYDLPERVKKSDTKSRKSEWAGLISDFCYVYNTDPVTVWERYPFPFFLELSNDLDRNKMRRRMEMGMGTAIGFGGVKKENLDEWQKIAYGSNGHSEPKSPKTDDEIRKALEEEYEYMKTYFR